MPKMFTLDISMALRYSPGGILKVGLFCPPLPPVDEFDIILEMERDLIDTLSSPDRNGFWKLGETGEETGKW